MNSQITILLSHPNLGNSIFNKYLTDINKNNVNICIHHLDICKIKETFDLEAEKEILKNSKALVWQFPIYWYNCPSSLRDWQDQVLSPIVYSADNFLKGKKLRVVFTAGAAEAEYSRTGLNRYTAEEMLRPFEMTANASGLTWLKPLGFFGCGPETSEKAMESMADLYKKNLLEML